MVKKILWILIAISLTSQAFGASGKELFEKGVLLLKQDQYQAAVDTFTELILMVPENPDAYKNRGVAYMKLNQYDQAIADFERTKEIMPGLKGLYSNLGVAWYYKADYAKAIENYDQEIALSPDNHFAFFNRAICRAELNQVEKSLADITQTLALAPDFYLALCLKGDLHVRLNQPLEAKQAYERAILQEPDQAYAQDRLAALKLDSKSSPRVQDKVFPETSSQGADPSPLPSDSPEPLQGQYELQAGAFSLRDNALALQKKLEEKGYTARIVESPRPGHPPWYLVKTGSYPGRQEADQARTLLKKQLGIDAIISSRDKNGHL